MHSDSHKGCGCGNHTEDIKHEDGCGCDNKGSEECGCESHGHDHGEGCGCGNHDHHHGHSVTLTLEDNTELVCPVLDIFEINEQEYIALLNPEEQTAMLYRFHETEDDSIFIENIDSEEEFQMVSKTFMSMQED